MTRNKSNLLPVAVATCLAVGSMSAAEKVNYQELRNRVAPSNKMLEHRSIKIQTSDGKNHKGRGMVLDTDHVRLFRSDENWEDIPSTRIVRLQVGQGGRFSHHIVESAAIPLFFGLAICGEADNVGSEVCAVPATLVFSPVWAYTVASAPFYLASDGIAFLIPPKVYEITH